MIEDELTHYFRASQIFYDFIPALEKGKLNYQL